MNSPFALAACAEMLWLDKPIDWRACRLKEMGFGVGLWNWPSHDLDALEKTGATFTIMNGYLHGTGLGDRGVPIVQTDIVTGAMWLKARDTLHRICDMAEAEDASFTLENLNLMEHPGCPFNRTADVLLLVSEVNRSQLRINLDLYHTQIGEGDVIRWAEKCLPWLGEVQVADNPGRCEPGTGEMNYPVIAKALFNMGYRGPVGLEAHAAGDPEIALDAFRAAFEV